ncbi:MAG: hypothetical protein WA197_05905 [Candidatus Acidiferrales bacterium]
MLSEAAIVGDAELRVSAACGFDHGETFIHVVGHGLFAEDVNSLREKLGGNGSGDNSFEFTKIAQLENQPWPATCLSLGSIKREYGVSVIGILN